MTFDPNSAVDHLRGPMSDPTTPVEVLANLFREHWYSPSQGKCLCGVVVVQRYHPEHVAEVVLQAQDYTITKGGLDVERLGRAMNNVLSWVDGFEPSEAARTLADEYAALEPTHD